MFYNFVQFSIKPQDKLSVKLSLILYIYFFKPLKFQATDVLLLVENGSYFNKNYTLL